MRPTLIMIAAVAALMLVGCSKEREPAEDLNAEIRLTSGVTGQTRTFGIDQQIEKDETVAVYVDRADIQNSEQIYGHNLLTCDGLGKLLGGTTMYFPKDKSAVDIYAFHPHTTLGDDYPAESFTHSVHSDQSVRAKYAFSDLLYAANRGVGFQKQEVSLTFYHMLSKVEVSLIPGKGINHDFSNHGEIKVYIIGTQLKADFKPSKAAKIAEEPVRQQMISITQADNVATDIEISNTISTNHASNEFVYNDAVIVPQTIEQNAQFIKIVFNEGGQMYYRLRDKTVFESGKKYQYNITVNLTELTVTSVVQDWDPIGPAVAGDAEME